MPNKNKFRMACVLVSSCLSCASFADSQDDDKDIHLESEVLSFSYSQVMPVVSTFGGVIPIGKIARESSYSDEPEAGREALTHNRFNLRLQYQNWFMIFASRYDYDVQFTPDAAQLFFLDKEERPVDKDIYNLFFKAKHIHANGVGVGYQWQKDALSVELSGYVWDVEHMENGLVDGQFLVADDRESYDIQGQINYAYFSDAILDRKNCPLTDPPVAGCHGSWQTQGTGYSIDAKIRYIFNSDWRIEARINDLWNRFSFDQLGRTVGSLDTRNQVFNADGSFSVNPSFSGQYPDGKHSLSLSPQLRLRVDGKYKIPLWSEIYAVNEQVFPALGVGYSLANWHIEGGYQWRTKSYLIGFKHPFVSLQFGSETWNVSEAKTITLNASFNFTF